MIQCGKVERKPWLKCMEPGRIVSDDYLVGKKLLWKKIPDSVIEIDVKEVDGKLYFSRFFCAFGPCIRGFLLGCRPYLSVDSTALNGRWNGHLPSVTAVDGHNWMFPLCFGYFILKLRTIGLGT